MTCGFVFGLQEEAPVVFVVDLSAWPLGFETFSLGENHPAPSWGTFTLIPYSYLFVLIRNYIPLFRENSLGESGKRGSGAARVSAPRALARACSLGLGGNESFYLFRI